MRGLPFLIAADDLQPVGTACPALGVPWATSGPFSPTIDKILPELGYVPGNVVVLSDRANRIKADATIPEIRSVLLYLESVLMNPQRFHG
jgi:hypothetical protein